MSKFAVYHIIVRALDPEYDRKHNKVTCMYNNKYMRRRCAGLFEGCVAPSGGTGAGQDDTGVRDQVYAMAYVRPQAYGQIMTDSDALLCGTLFPSLYLPFEGGGGR